VGSSSFYGAPMLKKKKKKLSLEGKGRWESQMGQEEGRWFDQDTLRVWEEKKWMGA